MASRYVWVNMLCSVGSSAKRNVKFLEPTLQSLQLGMFSVYASHNSDADLANKTL